LTLALVLAIMASVLADVPRLPFSLNRLIAEAKRRARRRRWLSLFVLVVAVAAAAAALVLRSASGSGLAVAAGRPVAHIVMEEPPTTVYFNLRTGRKTGGTSREEMWLDRQNGRERIAHTVDGRVVRDDVWTYHVPPTSEAAAVDHVYLSLVTSYRAALRSGAAKRVGRGTFRGHQIHWLHLRQPPVPSWRHHHPWPQVAKAAVGIDTHTYRPLILRFRSSHGKLGGYYVPVLVAKAIRYDPADFKRRGPNHPRAVPVQPDTGFAFGSTNPSAPRSTVVRAPWLTAGATVAGLKLRAVTPFTIRRSKHRFYYGAPKPKATHGLELLYGPPSQRLASTLPTRINVYGKGPRRTRFTTIYEVPQAPRVYPWSSVPANSIKVQSGLTTAGNHVVHTQSIGYLKERGLYITIRTPQGQHTALQIARSLHGAGK
jgi:hypothetical protein